LKEEQPRRRKLKKMNDIEEEEEYDFMAPIE